MALLMACMTIALPLMTCMVVGVWRVLRMRHTVPAGMHFEPTRQQKVDKYEEVVDLLKDDLQKASDERACARVDA